MNAKTNRKTLFHITTALFWFAMYAYVPIFPTYVESKGVSYSMVGIILGSYGFAQMLVRIPLGIISDTLNRRKIFVMAGLLFGLVSSLGLWFFSEPGFILIFRSVSGIAAATWVAYSVLYSSYYMPQETPKAIGYLTSITFFGQVCAVYLGGVFAKTLGDRSTFILAGGAAAAGLILSTGVVENRDVNRKPLKVNDLLKVARDKKLMLVSVLAIFIQFMTFATLYGFTPVAAEKLGASSYQLGLLTTLSALPGVIASALSGAFFARRFREKNVIITGFLISAASCFAIPYTGSLFLLFVSQIIGGFSRGMVFPLLMGMSIKSVKPEKRASAMGFFQAIYGLGMFGGPAVVGILGDVLSLDAGFMVTGAVGIAAAIIMSNTPVSE